MKWFSTKKFTPPMSTMYKFIVRLHYTPINLYSIKVADFEDGIWVDENWELIEDENHKVTHFCMPDPIEIEE